MIRVMARLCLLALLVTAKPALADEADDFVVAGTTFTVQHEIAHMLINVFELPAVGREEDAADQYAWLQMLPEDPDPKRDRLVRLAVRTWLLEAHMARREDDEVTFWAEHSHDMQRYYLGVCMAYGLDAETFHDLGTRSDMPQERLEECEGEAVNAAFGWAGLLDLADRNGSGRLDVVYDRPASNLKSYRKLAERVATAGGMIAALNRDHPMPHDVALRFTTCGERGAHYDPEDRQITICYEEMARYRTMYQQIRDAEPFEN